MVSSSPPLPRKYWGQNYLISERILQRIVQAARLSPNQKVVEIGPGTGNLTFLLAQAARQVLALEIDPRLCKFLQPALKHKNNVLIIQADAAKYDYQQLAEQYLDSEHPKFKLVANLPYYISTPILLKLIEQRGVFELMVLMLQAEVARRLAAEPGTKAYGALTITMRYYADIEFLMPVSRKNFKPQPQVDSAVVRITPLPRPRVEVRDEQLLFGLVKAAFAQRRKTIYNALNRAPALNLPSGLLKEVLTESDIDPGVRGETIGLEGFANLANNISRLHRNEMSSP
jgi:16S rRNA (adenine1518-N6/adenine1519-N6)-dimethyltransferase